MSLRPHLRVAVVALLGGVLLSTAGCGGAGRDSGVKSGSGFSPEGRAAANHFLDTYVEDDGRVLRHDQGDDVVSEGQAYGMVIAELVGDSETARRIWSWTDAHLRRPDELLSFHAGSDGTVIDHESATDADILAAYALLRYDGPDASALHRDGRRLADAVLAHETAKVGSDGVVPVAGSWVQGDPAWVNPSYWMPGVVAGLADLTGDDRWATMARTEARLASEVTGRGDRLPPDWAQLSGGAVQASGAPDGGTPVQYGPDAQRLPVFLAACQGTGSGSLAARWWPLLQNSDRSSALALGLGGEVRDGTPTALASLAAAATARAAGQDGRAAELVGAATDRTHSAPTYYGDAWLALAAGLAEHRFGAC